MKNTIKKIWIKALESGKYFQGKGNLRKTSFGVTRHCCLGVLCELYNKHELKTDSKKLLKWNAFGTIEETANQKVLNWAGLKNETQSKLAQLNDSSPRGDCYKTVIAKIKKL